MLRDRPQQQELELPRASKPVWVRLPVLSTYAAAKPVAAIRIFYANMEEYGLR